MAADASSEVEVLLQFLDLGDYVSAFEQNEVRDVETLLLLTENDVKELVPSIGARRKLVTWMELENQQTHQDPHQQHNHFQPDPPQRQHPAGLSCSQPAPVHRQQVPAKIKTSWQEIQTNHFSRMKRVPHQSSQRREPTVEELFKMQQTVDEQGMEEMHTKYHVQVHGAGIPELKGSFKDLLFGAWKVLKNIETCRFIQPTPVQQYAISCCREGRDLIGVSQTGTGKTAAFLLPILSTLEVILVGNVGKPRGGNGLILSPTRELATQTYDECRKFASGTQITMVLLVGGEPMRLQIGKMREGAHLWHATPARLVDLLMQMETYDLQAMRYFVLDEADQMLQDGSQSATLRFLLEGFNIPPPGQKQTLIFAATMSPELMECARKLLAEEIIVQTEMSSPPNIRHNVLLVPRNEKPAQLTYILRDLPRDAQVLIFVSHTTTVDHLEQYLRPSLPPGYRVAGLSSSRLPKDRQVAIQQFKQRNIQYLIGTDILARGLDFPDLGFVINFDMPRNVAEYIHRVGRTGRMNRQGTAISFFDRQSDGHLEQQLLSYLREMKQPLPQWANSTLDTSEHPVNLRGKGKQRPSNFPPATGPSTGPQPRHWGPHPPYQPEVQRAEPSSSSQYNARNNASVPFGGRGTGAGATGPSRRFHHGPRQHDHDQSIFD
eukprot:GGOE01021492.1.p1 GENE.GGOE01021492.1~~GGOE01021492.1.p1  ORF type:complete len:662 (-),score=138.60 GGOE01021492.1:475-2460(-)